MNRSISRSVEGYGMLGLLLIAALAESHASPSIESVQSPPNAHIKAAATVSLAD